MKREAGVMFGNTNGYDWLAGDGAKIAWAQWRILNPSAGLVVRQGFDDAVLKQCTGVGNLALMTPGNWQVVGRSFGVRVRAAKART